MRSIFIAFIGMVTALLSLTGGATVAGATGTYEIQGEWSYVLACETCTTSQKMVSGTATIRTMGPSGEYSGATELEHILSGTISGTVTGTTQLSVLVDFPSTPEGPVSFSATTATLNATNNTFSGSGFWKDAKESPEGTITAKRVRSLQQIEEQEAKEKLEREGREKGEAEGRPIGEKEGREKGEQEGREKGEAEGLKKGETEGQEKGAAEGRGKAEQEVKAKAEQETKERQAKEAQAQAERVAREKTEKEAAEKADTQAREKIEREAREKAAKERQKAASKKKKSHKKGKKPKHPVKGLKAVGRSRRAG